MKEILTLMLPCSGSGRALFYPRPPGRLRLNQMDPKQNPLYLDHLERRIISLLEYNNTNRWVEMNRPILTCSVGITPQFLAIGSVIRCASIHVSSHDGLNKCHHSCFKILLYLQCKVFCCSYGLNCAFPELDESQGQGPLRGSAMVIDWATVHCFRISVNGFLEHTH